MVTADCLNTKSSNGRNLTPLPLLDAARDVLGVIELDPASDAIANEYVQAEMYYTLEQDGFILPWCDARTIWLNAPGRTTSNGKTISASDWYRKLYQTWCTWKTARHYMGLVYRAGSIGSLGVDLLADSTICLTASGDNISPCINGSGRLSFDIVDGDRRMPQTSNTQSSLIFLLSRDKARQKLFREKFSCFGVVK
jgi:hypothetical protein